jgi:hypothetical protein
MAGIFDRLQNELDDRESEGGITPLDLADLPAPLRKLMRLMLRKVELDYDSITEAVEGMPEADQMSKEDLDLALEELRKKGWLIKRGEGESVSYKVNLRRKASSTLSGGIWGTLDDKIDQQKSDAEPDEELT